MKQTFVQRMQVSGRLVSRNDVAVVLERLAKTLRQHNNFLDPDPTSSGAPPNNKPEITEFDGVIQGNYDEIGFRLQIRLTHYF